MGSDRVQEPNKRGKKLYATPDRGAKKGGHYKLSIVPPSCPLSQTPEANGGLPENTGFGEHAALTFTSVSLESSSSRASPESYLPDNKLENNFRRLYAPENVGILGFGDIPGMPKRAKWKSIVDAYLDGLHPSKRTKALINQETYNMIYLALRDPDSTRVGTAQFRFWVRRMFRLSSIGAGIQVVTHENRQVAIKENVYDILCSCHAESAHGGRDRTVKILHKYYTWVPKELVANFVKACPLCVTKKRGNRVEGTVFSLNANDGLSMGAQYCVASIEDFGRSPPRGLETDFVLPAPGQYSSSLAPCEGPPYEEPRMNLPPPIFFEFTHSGEASPSFNDIINEKMILPPPQTTLPPLMKYLSQDAHCNMQQHQNLIPPPAVSVPIDPSLLNNIPRQDPPSTNEYSHTSYGKQPTNALDLQLFPPPHQEINSNPERVTMGPSMYTWKLREEPEVCPDNDSSVPALQDSETSILHSASSASSMGLPTPSSSIGQVSGEPVFLRYIVQSDETSQDAAPLSPQHYEYFSCENPEGLKEPTREEVGGTLGIVQASSGTPLFSPVPVKFKDTSAMMELVSGSGLQE